MDIVVTVAVSLVNMLTPGEEHGHPYPPPDEAGLPPAATTALRAGRPDTRDVTLPEARELAGFAVAFRVVFAAVAAGDVDTAARQVNDLITATGAGTAVPVNFTLNAASDSTNVKALVHQSASRVIASRT